MGSSFHKPDPSLARLTSLSREISEQTRILTDSMAAARLSAPSLHADGPADFPLGDMDEPALAARQRLVNLTRELHLLALGARETLRSMACDSVSLVPLHAIAEFKIAQAVPRDRSVSYPDLAAKVRKLAGVDVPAYDLRRLLRLAMANAVFCEPEPGRVSHNRCSLLLLDDDSMDSWVGMFTSDLLAAVAATVPAMKRWPASEEANETGHNLAYGHSASFFAHLQQDKARSARYDKAMRSMGSREGFEISHTVRSYPWGKLGRGTVVDMGGNQGFVSMALAEAFPALSFEVQDLAGLRTAAAMAEVPAHLAQRVRLTTHDFLQPQPVMASAYLFRHVFHALTDKYAVAALRALVPALRPGARVIINDEVLLPPGAAAMGAVEEKSVRLLDVLMKTVCNSRDRDEREWEGLFRRADARFKWQGAWKSTGRMWFMEAVWEEEGEDEDKEEQHPQQQLEEGEEETGATK